LGYVDEAVTDLFDRLDKRVTPIPVILAETFRSLNACRNKGEERFIGCAQLLLVWFHSHFWKVDKVSYRVFFKDYSPLKELAATPRCWLCAVVGTSTGSLYLGFGELLVMRRCWY
ncbi:hypothetical protein Gohar_022392, partial [Gossypium harknessii]|nr:hypothetical protein [Gossypium harknessii]